MLTLKIATSYDGNDHLKLAHFLNEILGGGIHIELHQLGKLLHDVFLGRGLVELPDESLDLFSG